MRVPGDTPQEAVPEFLAPLRAALAVLDGRGAIDVDPSTNDLGKPLRVTTLAYNHKLELATGTDKWRMHWHPDGISDTREHTSGCTAHGRHGWICPICALPSSNPRGTRARQAGPPA